MAIHFRCPCGKTIKAKDEMAGKKFRCPDCGKAMQVPEPEVVEENAFEDEADDFEEERRPAPRGRASGGRKPRKAPAKSSSNGLIFGLAAAALAFALVVGGAVFVMTRQAKQMPVANNPPAQVFPEMPNQRPNPMPGIDPNPGAIPDAGIAQPAQPPVVTTPPIVAPAIVPSVPVNPGDRLWVVLSNFKQKTQGGGPFDRGYTVDYRLASGSPDPSKKYVLYVSNPSAGGGIEHYLEIDVPLQASGTINFAGGPGFGIASAIKASIALKKGRQEWEKVSGEIAPGGAESIAQAPPTVQQIAGAAAQGKPFALANAKSGQGGGLSPDITVEYVLQGTPEPGRFYFLVAKPVSGGDGGIEFDVSNSIRRAKQGETSTMGGRVIGPGLSGAMNLHIEKRMSPFPNRIRRQPQDEPEIVSNTVMTQ